MQNQQRKQETREKIQLGGLVKKAGLHTEETAVLLGLLIEAREKLDEDEANDWRKAWKLRGDIAFTQS